MKHKQMIKKFCMRCRRDLTGADNSKACECGSRHFIFGKTLVMTEKSLSCSCGSNSVKLLDSSVNGPNNKFNAVLECTSCNAYIMVEMENNGVLEEKNDD